MRIWGRNSEAAQEEKERSVEIAFVVSISNSQATADDLYVSGNAASLGSWAGTGLKLTTGIDNLGRASVKVPRGDSQFKVTGGSWERVKLRDDGRSISNRRARIQTPREIRVEVASLKSAKEQDQVGRSCFNQVHPCQTSTPVSTEYKRATKLSIAACKSQLANNAQWKSLTIVVERSPNATVVVTIFSSR